MCHPDTRWEGLEPRDTSCTVVLRFEFPGMKTCALLGEQLIQNCSRYIGLVGLL
jgi:hypothetical protein